MWNQGKDRMPLTISLSESRAEVAEKHRGKKMREKITKFNLNKDKHYVRDMSTTITAERTFV